MYDAFETPRAVRGDLPLLDREQALDYLETSAGAVPAGDGFIHELVLRHEHQHGETMLQTIELARLRPAAGRARAMPRPDAPGGHSGLESVAVPAGPCVDRRARRSLRLRQRAPAPPHRRCARSGSAARRSPTRRT